METRHLDIPSKWIDCLVVRVLVRMGFLVVKGLVRMGFLVVSGLVGGQLPALVPFACTSAFSKSVFLNLLYKVVSFIMAFSCMYCSCLSPPHFSLLICILHSLLSSPSFHQSPFPAFMYYVFCYSLFAHRFSLLRLLLLHSCPPF